MMNQKNTRKTIIQSVNVILVEKGSDLYPPPDIFVNPDALPDYCWIVEIQVQEGSLPPWKMCSHYLSKDDAEKSASNWNIGNEYPPLDKALGKNLVEWIKMPLSRMRFEEHDLDLARGVLENAEIFSNFNLEPLKELEEYFDKERIDSFKAAYGKNWLSAARFEFCHENVPNSSPVYIAAQIFYSLDITGECFKAGYLARDLEILVYGVEQGALKAEEMRQKAGGAGGEQSRNLREKRRSDLLDKMEALALRSPDIVRFGQEKLAELAAEDCARDNPNLWKQGKGQVNYYLGEIRRGEAGGDMKARFQALFGSKPPKRLG